VLIGGSPASGKTTLGDELGKALGFPVLHRDPISEAIADVSGPARLRNNESWSP